MRGFRFLMRPYVPGLQFVAIALTLGVLGWAMASGGSEDATGAMLAVAPVLATSALADQIGQTRRDQAALIDQRGELMVKIDQMETEELALKQKADRSDEDNAKLTKLSQEIGEQYKQVRQLTQKIDQLGNQERDLQERYDMRNAHNADVQQLSRSTGRQTQQPPGNIETDHGNRDIGNARVIDRPLTQEERRRDLGQFFLAHGQAALNRQSPIQVARDVLKNDRLAQAMTAGSNPGIIPENYRAELIELLYPNSVIRRMNPILLPLNNSNLSIPKMATGASAAYAAEVANIVPSDPTTTEVTLSGKKLTVMVPVSRDLIRNASPGADAIIRSDIVMAAGAKEDVTFLRSTSAVTTPKGLLGWVSAAIHANATVNVANIIADLTKLTLALENANCPRIRPGWAMAPRVRQYLADLRENGMYVFPTLQDENPRLRGFPVFTSTQIPTNLGVGTNQSEIYFADAGDLILAEEPLFELETSTEGAYHDGSAVQAAFSKDIILYRLITKHDFAPRHAESVAVLDQVTWGG